MMKRKAMQSLLEWKASANRKPLILRGARQVGKTWLMESFAEQHFQSVVKINFDEDDVFKQIFESNYDIPRIINALQLKSNITIEPGKTLIIFDEIQEAPGAVTCLKYFCENAPEYFVIAAGSLLGVTSLEGTGFPVGKVDFIDLYPMNFCEFLEATGHERFVELLKSGDWVNITTFKKTFIENLRYYYFVGGMPEVVASFISNHDLKHVRIIQQQLLDSYERDFSKHAPASLVPRIRLVWNSIASQLAKENRKFVYGALRKNARASEFELAIQWLKDAGLIHRISRVAKAGIPLASYQDSSFKLFTHDVGLLAALSGLDAQSIIYGNQIFEEFKGALTEQYVLQQLISECKLNPYYWSTENSSGEIDFIFQFGGKVIPLEVKAEENLKARSLMFYSRKNKVPLALRTSMSDFRKDIIDAIASPKDDSAFQFDLLNLPLYAISQLTTVCKNPDKSGDGSILL
jgi:uncharacterized protein